MPRILAASLASLLVLATVAGASDSSGDASPPPTPPALDARDAKKRVAAFEKGLAAARRAKPEEARREAEVAAVHALSGGAHERIAGRLGEAAGDDRLLLGTREAALAAVPAQGDAARAAAGPVADWLQIAAERAADDLKESRLELPVDRRTGDPITTGPAAEEALRVGAARARLLAAGITTLRTLEHTPRRPADVLRPFLQSPHDDLALAALEAAQAWDARDLAEDLALLLRMYPRENRWETGAVTHLSGTDATAKAAWMTLFGHPLKQRPRPAVHRAVVACLSAFAGRPIGDVAACEAWLAERSGGSRRKRRR